MVNGIFTARARPVLFAGSTPQTANPAAAKRPSISSNALIFIRFFPLARGLQNPGRAARLGEQPARFGGRPAWEGRRSRSPWGIKSMENTLLIGLSRQTALAARTRRHRQQRRQRQHRRLQGRQHGLRRFPLHAPAPIVAFAARPPPSAPCSDNMTWHDMSQGTVAAHRRSARRRHRRRRHAGGADRARRALHPQRRACSSTTSANSSPSPATRSWATTGRSVLHPTDRDIVHQPGRHHQGPRGRQPQCPTRTRGKLRLVNFANPQQLRKQGASTFAAPDGVQPVRSPKATRMSCRARSRSRTCGRWSRCRA